MATDNEKISKAVQGVLAFIKKNAPEEQSKLIADGKLKDAITTEARKAAEEEVKLAHEFASQPQQDIRKRLEKHLPEDRIRLIEKALTIPTFRMEVRWTMANIWCSLREKERSSYHPGSWQGVLASIGSIGPRFFSTPVLWWRR